MSYLGTVQPRVITHKHRRLVSYPLSADHGCRAQTELKNIAPNTPMVAWTQWVPYTKDTLVYYHWQMPSGKLIKKKFNVKKGWSDTRVKIPVQSPIPKGEWSLTIKENDQALLQGSFVVQ